MRIKFVKNKSFEPYNRLYHHNIEGSVERIFTTQNTGSIGYQKSSYLNTEDKRHHYVDDDMYDVQRSIQSGIPHISMSGLGPCERALLDKICNPGFPFVVVTGALGSGKSTLVNFIADHIKKTIECNKCHEKDSCLGRHWIVEVIDLMQIQVDLTNEDKVFDKFLKTLVLALARRLEDILKDSTIMNSFCRRLETKSVKKITSRWLDHFYDFEYEVLEDSTEWNKHSDIKKAKLLIEWIKNKHSDIEDRLDLFTQLLAALREDFPQRLQGCLVMIYDNIDSYKASTQQRIITYLSSLSEITGVITILTVRLTTYGKILDTSGNRSYTRYQHAGPQPIEIICNRLAHYINIESHQQTSTISQEHKSIFDNKVNTIYNILTDNEGNSRVKGAISALSGNSIRRGLALAERMFLNDTQPFDDTVTITQDSIIRSILLGKNEDLLLTSEDPYLSNIFLNNYDKTNSLICIRILQILLYKKQSNKKATLFDVVENIRSFCPYNKDSIIFTLKYLSEDRKRLIFFLGKNTWDAALDNPSYSQDFELEITNSGVLYLKNLASELSYVQCAFQSLDWTNQERNLVLSDISDDLVIYIRSEIERSNNNTSVKESVKQFLLNGDYVSDLPLSIDYNSTLERLSALRIMLRLFLANDFLQTIRYSYDSNTNARDNPIIEEVFFLKTIGLIATSVYHILKTDMAKKEEFLNWYELCLTSSNIGEVLFPKSKCAELEHAIRLYSGELKNK